FKTFEISGRVRIIWDVYKNIDMDKEHTIGARVRSLEQLPEPQLTHLTDTDVLFVVRETKFAAHKSYVSALSPVFYRMFNGDSRESSDKEVKIEDTSSDEFGSFLAWLYHNPKVIHVSELLHQCLAYVRLTSSISLTDKFIMADKYCDKGLQRYLLDLLTVDDAEDLLE
ncbi:Speckle-type POZ protein-like protein, partial [Aphelenchoides avenae]